MTTLEHADQHNERDAGGPKSIQETLFDMPERLDKEYHYQLLDNEELRTRYVRYTEKLISNVIDDKDDYVVFLDKSARPVAWLTKALWPTLGIDDRGEPVKMPEFLFANIDREQWEILVGRSTDTDNGGGLGSVSDEVIQELHDTYATYGAEGAPDIDTSSIRVVDEVMASGDTIRLATGLFQRAFPDAEVRNMYWMTPETKMDKRSGAVYNADLPIWYDSENIKGRLVGNRSSKSSSISNSAAQRKGATFLSTRFKEVDQSGLILKREMQQLAEEVRAGLIPVTPGSVRSLESQEYIINHVNRLSIEEYIQLKHESEQTGVDFTKLYKDYKLARLESSRRAHPSQNSN